MAVLSGTPAARAVFDARRSLRALRWRIFAGRDRGHAHRLARRRVLLLGRVGARLRLLAALLLARATAAQAARGIEVSGGSGGGTHGLGISPCMVQSCTGIHAERR